MADDVGFSRPPRTNGWLQSGKDWVGKRSKTERTLLIIAAVVVAFLSYGTYHWWTVGQYEQKTDNAYVRADISIISAKVSGYVRNVAVTDNESVAAGQPLLMLDASDYEAAVAQARANLARAEAEVASIGAQRALAAADLARYRPLARSGILSPAGMQQIEARSAQMGATLSASEAAVAAARAQLEAAQLNLERTIVRAPVAGVVGDRQVQLGQLVQPGAPLMAVVPMHSLHVVANYKETQLARIHPGQRAVVRPDVDHSLVLEGVVDSIAPASGAEFSIIPMDTATGNFTKIVQRVPVRIRLDTADPRVRALLRPGLSVSVMIDTHPNGAPPRIPPGPSRTTVAAQ